MKLHCEYGLWDGVDGCWLGDGAEPMLYDDRSMATIAARVCEKRLGWHVGRVQPLMYDGTGNTVRDTLEAKMTAVEAIEELEKPVTQERQGKDAQTTFAG